MRETLSWEAKLGARSLGVFELQVGNFSSDVELEDFVNEVGANFKKLLFTEICKELDKWEFPENCPKCGSKLRDKGMARPKIITTSFGNVLYKRRKFFCERCKQVYYPLDDKLNLSKKNLPTGQNK